jgi:hypothetical protein
MKEDLNEQSKNIKEIRLNLN